MIITRPTGTKRDPCLLAPTGKKKVRKHNIKDYIWSSNVRMIVASACRVLHQANRHRLAMVHVQYQVGGLMRRTRILQ